MTILDECSSLMTTCQPKKSRKVSLSSMSRKFNDVVCIDHFHLEGNRVFHIMDLESGYSTGDVVDTMSMSDEIYLFESLWITQFWTPKTVLHDPAFENTEFTEFLNAQDIEHRPIPRRRHYKNVIESKQHIIRDIYLRLKHECNEAKKCS